MTTGSRKRFVASISLFGLGLLALVSVSMIGDYEASVQLSHQFEIAENDYCASFYEHGNYEGALIWKYCIPFSY